MTETIDRHGDRLATMWMEAGIQFRANLVQAGKEIGLHAHSYDHVSIVTAGWFAVRDESPNGDVREYQLAARDFRTDDPTFNPEGYRITIPAWHKHAFRCLGGAPGEVLCLWADGHDQDTDGEDTC
jgi:mannose-6-phosphate isomerase-like protein (cupin superfamily)